MDVNNIRQKIELLGFEVSCIYNARTNLYSIYVYFCDNEWVKVENFYKEYMDKCMRYAYNKIKIAVYGEIL